MGLHHTYEMPHIYKVPHIYGLPHTYGAAPHPAVPHTYGAAAPRAQPHTPRPTFLGSHPLWVELWGQAPPGASPPRCPMVSGTHSSAP